MKKVAILLTGTVTVSSVTMYLLAVAIHAITGSIFHEVTNHPLFLITWVILGMCVMYSIATELYPDSTKNDTIADIDAKIELEKKQKEYYDLLRKNSPTM